jgi:hypothetical protein
MLASLTAPQKPRAGVGRVDDGDTSGGAATIVRPAATREKPLVSIGTATAAAVAFAETQPPTGLPSAGEVGLDLHLIEHGLASFFARLSGPLEEGDGQASAAGIVSCLAAVATAALEIARVRDKARRSPLSPDGIPSRTAASAGV